MTMPLLEEASLTLKSFSLHIECICQYIFEVIAKIVAANLRLYGLDRTLFCPTKTDMDVVLPGPSRHA